MIPSDFVGFHKKTRSGMGGGGFLTAFFSGLQTFVTFFEKRKGLPGGDVICYGANYDKRYALDYAVFPQAGAIYADREIPVENSYFSTFSTDFSTRVFHRDVEMEYALWINITQL